MTTMDICLKIISMFVYPFRAISNLLVCIISHVLICTCRRSVLISDINPRMLEVGQKRAQTILTPSQQSRTDWLEGDAENLGSIPDNTFDAYTIAFGIRNCVHVDKVKQIQLWLVYIVSYKSPNYCLYFCANRSYQKRTEFFVLVADLCV